MSLPGPRTIALESSDVLLVHLYSVVGYPIGLLLQSSAVFKILLRGESDQTEGQCLVNTKLQD
jgi:hypothetical protein